MTDIERLEDEIEDLRSEVSLVRAQLMLLLAERHRVEARASRTDDKPIAQNGYVFEDIINAIHPEVKK